MTDRVKLSFKLYEGDDTWWADMRQEGPCVCHGEEHIHSVVTLWAPGSGARTPTWRSENSREAFEALQALKGEGPV
jgi:hypothetical protein